MKTCGKCKNDKPPSEFSPQKQQGGRYVYLSPYCKECKKAAERERRAKNSDEIRLKDKIRWVGHRRSEGAAYRKNYYLRNRNKFLLAAKDSHILCKADPARRTGQRPMPKLEDFGLTTEFYNAERATRSKNASMPVAMLRERLRSRSRQAVKTGWGRGILKFLGAPVSLVRDNIQANFKPDMTWENYGKLWHIDHHVPLFYFDLTNEEQAKCAFNWRNLRPLYAKENLMKSSSIPEDAEEFIANIKRLLK